MRGVSDSDIEAILESRTSPGTNRHALRHGSPAYLGAFSEIHALSPGLARLHPEQAATVRASVAIGTSAGSSLPPATPPTFHTGDAYPLPGICVVSRDPETCGTASRSAT